MFYVFGIFFGLVWICIDRCQWIILDTFGVKFRACFWRKFVLLDLNKIVIVSLFRGFVVSVWWVSEWVSVSFLLLLGGWVILACFGMCGGVAGGCRWWYWCVAELCCELGISRDGLNIECLFPHGPHYSHSTLPFLSHWCFFRILTMSPALYHFPFTDIPLISWPRLSPRI